MNRVQRRRTGSIAVVLMVCAALPGGCNRPARQVAGLNQQIVDLKHENLHLRDQLGAAQAEAERLEQSVANLRMLGDTRFDHLYTVARVEIDRRSNATGEDGVTLYLNLFDHDDHRFKAAGEISTYLYDMSDPQQVQGIGECRLSVEQARAQWYGRLLTYHYKVVCPWTRRPTGRAVLVRVRFVDYLSGQPFEDSRELQLSPYIAED